MKINKFQTSVILGAVLVLLVSGQCLAQELTFIQKFIYKEIYVVEPNGHETLARVNKLTDKVEYIQGANGWIAAPLHIQYCYTNRETITKRVKKRYH